MLSYRNGRDLSGFADGSASPQGERAIEAAFIDQGSLREGSVALVQRFLHFRDRFATMSAEERGAVVGRTEESDEELHTAPRSAHIKRADQGGFDSLAFILRRSMPWGDSRRHGLQFIAFMNRLDKAQRRLRRMAGIEDGLPDALLGHTQAGTGAFYFVPAVAGGRPALLECGQAEESMSSQEAPSVIVAAPIRFHAVGWNLRLSSTGARGSALSQP